MENNNFNIKKLENLVKEGYISKVKHSTEELYIYNYTPKTVFNKIWNNETLQCRGLILDDKYNIVARPFKKFFNLEEDKTKLPIEPFEITEKEDGSLGIVYFIDSKPYIATRGSFTSDQAKEANKILKEKYGNIFGNPNLTYLLEIIFPENQVVINYHGMRDLILLAVIETKTNKEWNYKLIKNTFEGIIPIVKSCDGISDFNKLKELQEDNKEGFVVKFESGLRIKVKFDEYVRLHRLVTGVNKKTIWELLKNHQEFNELIERVPDEFIDWVKKSKAELEEEYNKINIQAHLDMVKISEEMILVFGEDDFQLNRKYFAQQAFKTKYPDVLFRMLDKKPYDELIWKRIRPEAAKPFKEQMEDI